MIQKQIEGNRRCGAGNFIEPYRSRRLTQPQQCALNQCQQQFEFKSISDENTVAELGNILTFNKREVFYERRFQTRIINHDANDYSAAK